MSDSFYDIVAGWTEKWTDVIYRISASSNPGLLFFGIISEHGLLFEHGLLLFQPFFDREYTAYNNVVPLLSKNIHQSPLQYAGCVACLRAPRL